MPREFKQEYPEYLRKAARRVLESGELRDDQTAAVQIYLLTGALNFVTSDDEAHDMILIDLADLAPNEFGEEQIKILYAFFAGSEPSQCKIGAENFCRAIVDLRGDRLLAAAIDRLLNATADPAALGGAILVGGGAFVVECGDYD